MALYFYSKVPSASENHVKMVYVVYLYLLCDYSVQVLLVHKHTRYNYYVQK